MKVVSDIEYKIIDTSGGNIEVKKDEELLSRIP